MRRRRIRATGDAHANARANGSGGPQPASDWHITEWLIGQAHDTSERIHSLVMADERLMAIGISLLGTAASVAIAKNQSHLLMALPFAVTILFCFVEHLHVNLLGLGGYKRALEERLLERTGFAFDLWETAVAPKIHNNAAVTMLRSMIVLFYAGSVAIALNRAFDTRTPGHWGHRHSTLLVTITVLSIAFGALASYIARRSASQQFYVVLETTRLEMRRLEREAAAHRGEPQTH